METESESVKASTDHVVIRESYKKNKKRRKKKKEGEVLKSKTSTRTKKKTPRNIKSPRNLDTGDSFVKLKKKRHSRTRKKGNSHRWKHLPTEVLAEIFSMLTFDDMRSIVLVCKTWRYLYYKYASIVDFRNCFRRVTCAAFSTVQIRNILEPYSNIEYLSLCSCENMTNTTLIMLCNKFQHSLRLLDVSNCALVADTSVQSIITLPHLKTLGMASCEKITPEGFQRILRYHPRLEHLDLSYNKTISDEVLHMTHYMNNLQTLNLTATSVTGSFLGHAPTSITHLFLSSCETFDAEEFVSYLDYFQNIKVLDLSYCPRAVVTKWNMRDPYKDNTAQDINDVIPCIVNNLPHLETLILRGNLLSSDSIEEISKIDSLCALDLTGCDGFTLDALAALTECCSLQRLDLTECSTLLTQRAMEFVLLYFGHLQCVYLPTGQFFKDYDPQRDFVIPKPVATVTSSTFTLSDYEQDSDTLDEHDDDYFVYSDDSV